MADLFLETAKLPWLPVMESRELVSSRDPFLQVSVSKVSTPETEYCKEMVY